MSDAPRYTSPAIALHWVIAILIILNVILGFGSNNNWFPADDVRPIINFHKSTGLLVLVLVVIRLAWRATHIPPPLPAGYKPWEVTVSHIAHVLLYVVALGLPLTGWAHDSAWTMAAHFPFKWYGLFTWPHMGFFAHMPDSAKNYWHSLLGTAHTWFSYALYVLLVGHIGGALKHQLIDKEAEFQRMLPKFK